MSLQGPVALPYRAKLQMHSPESSFRMRLLADIHSREKDYRALLNDLDEYLKLDPDSPIAVRAKGLRSAAERLLEPSSTSALALPQS